MKSSSPTSIRRSWALPLLISVTCVCSAAWAGKPEWAGNGHGNGKKEQPQDTRTAEIQIGAYFADHQRVAVSSYYDTQRTAKKCPPGLAKKNNGCLPPGQAKKWNMGQALPGDVVFYPVPNEVIVRIGVPPQGYRYVRVANDILLMAIGSRMVVDAIEDLMRP
jgi:Ni/Co efflux regulator RcnB